MVEWQSTPVNKVGKLPQSHIFWNGEKQDFQILVINEITKKHDELTKEKCLQMSERSSWKPN